MPKPLFITGTDTGVGKTFVTGGICLLARQRGLAVGVMKPVETGCIRRDGRLVPADATFLAACADRSADALDTICPYRFAPPIAPDTAARLAGARIDFTRLGRSLGRIGCDKDLVLVEGAGGLLAPLGERRTMGDLARFLGARVLLVVGSKLGCLNHALLTISELEHRRLPVVGIVVNRIVPPGGDDLSVETNECDLARHTDVPIFGTLPYVDGGPAPLDEGVYREIFEDSLAADALLVALGAYPSLAPTRP